MRRASVILATAALVIAGCSGDDDDAGSADRDADSAIGGSAVARGLGVDMSSDAEFAQACADYAADPDGFSEEAASKSPPVGGQEIQPIPADVHAWADIAF